jgi:hypothetical protein
MAPAALRRRVTSTGELLLPAITYRLPCLKLSLTKKNSHR